MLWFLLAFVATIIASITNISDKVLVSKYLKNPFLGTIVCNIAGIPILSAAFLLKPPEILSMEEFVRVFIAVLFGIAGTLLYFKAMQKAEASRVLVTLQAFPVFVLVFAIIFLGETPSYVQIAGIVLVVIATMLVSAGKLDKNRWALATLLCSFLWAINAVTIKHILASVDYWSLFLWSSAMILAIYVLALPLYFKELKSSLLAKPRLLTFAFLSQGSFFTSYVLRLLAFSIGYVSLVSVVGALQPFIVLAFAFVVSRFAPFLFKETFDVKSAITKIASVVLAVFGTLLLL